VPVLLDVGGGGQLRIEALGARRQRPGGRRDVLERRPAHRHDDVHALRSAGLHRSGQPGVLQRLPDEPGGPDDHREVRALRRVEVEDQAGRLRVRDAEERDVELDGALVGQPQERAPVVAEHLGDLAVRPLRPDGHGAHPVRRALGHVALHERRLSGADPLDRQRTPGQQRHQPVGDGVEVVDEVALGHGEVVTEGLVETGQPYAVPFLLHATHRAGSSPGGQPALPAGGRRVRFQIS
jgi:hypothetical protein